MPLDQATRFLSVKIDGLPENELLLKSFSGHEELSRLFSFQLDMISDNNGIEAKQVVGKNVSFEVTLADDSSRHFNGFINRFSAGDEDERSQPGLHERLVVEPPRRARFRVQPDRLVVATVTHRAAEAIAYQAPARVEPALRR